MEIKKIINSKQLLIEDFLKHFQEYKVFKQKSFYVDGGADLYYDMVGLNKEHVIAIDNSLYPFLKRECLDKSGLDKKYVLISLGCGNSYKEKAIGEASLKDNVDLFIVAVDSSPEMIELSEEILKDSQFGYQLLCADFSKDELHNHILNEFSKDVPKIYGFLGGTIGNVEQDYIADILYDLSSPGDMLWLDVVVREMINDKGDRLLFERYLNYLENPKTKYFFFHPLEELGVSEQSGELYLSMETEETLNALKFVFRYRFNQKVVINLEGHTVNLLPGMTVDLFTIRAYDPEGLNQFFEERSFKPLAQEFVKGSGQFLFEKQT